MSTLSIPNTPGTGTPPLNEFTVINDSTVSYAGTLYQGVTTITFPDGTVKTCASILADAGGSIYSESELKPCVKVEAYDPEQNNRQVFSAYSNNSRQTSKNAIAEVVGGLWIEVFNFQGTAANNSNLQLWKDFLGAAYSDDGGGVFSKSWLGFKINYGAAELRAYVLTHINNFGEESIPCDPVEISVPMLSDVQVSGIFVAKGPVNNDFPVPIDKIRLYRSNVGASGNVAYQAVPCETISIDPHPVSMAVTFPTSVQTDYGVTHGWQIRDNAESAALGVSLPSLDWDPPAAGLMGLTAWRNGIMVAFKGNDIYFTEPYRPFTFPQKYRRSLPRKILALRTEENYLVAITDGEPYLFNGAHPLNVSYEKLENGLAGVQANTIGYPPYMPPTRAITTTTGGIVYASHEGPVAVRGAQVTPLGRALFTREDWLQRYRWALGTMRFAYYDGNLVAYTPSGGLFSVNMVDGDPRMTELTFASGIVGEFILPIDDSLYVLTPAASGGNWTTLSRYADENAQRYFFEWQSKDFVFPRPLNFTCGQVTAWGLGGALFLIVIADGNYVSQAIVGPFEPSQGLSSAVSFRIESGFKARRWSVKLISVDQLVVREVHLAESMMELMSV